MAGQNHGGNQTRLSLVTQSETKDVGGWSTTAIGRFYNGRDHSTVCYALKRVESLREADPEVDGLVSALTDEIKTNVAEGTGRTGGPTWTRASGKDLPLNDALLDALADRLAMRIFDRVRARDTGENSPR